MISDLQVNGYHFLSGAAMMGGLVCGRYFMGYWKRTGDRFFFLFALAFFTLALERICLIFVNLLIEDQQPVVYLIRMMAFSLILYAIWEKNRPQRPGNRDR